MGVMLEAIPDFHSSGKGTMKRKELPPGIEKKDSHYAQIKQMGRIFPFQPTPAEIDKIKVEKIWRSRSRL